MAHMQKNEIMCHITQKPTPSESKVQTCVRNTETVRTKLNLEHSTWYGVERTSWI